MNRRTFTRGLVANSFGTLWMTVGCSTRVPAHPARPTTNLQVFTGYQFLGKLAGTFEAFATAGGSPTKNVFGWYATH